MPEWFRRKSQNIKTKTRKDTKEGMWIKCPSCGEVVYSNLLVNTCYLCPSCSYHFNYSSKQYIDLLENNIGPHEGSDILSDILMENRSIEELNFFKSLSSKVIVVVAYGKLFQKLF